MNSYKITLGGQAFDLFWFRGNGLAARRLLSSPEQRLMTPKERSNQALLGRQEPKTMYDWFMVENYADEKYAKQYMLNKNALIFFIMGKDGRPIGFFPILGKQKEAVIGEPYLMQEFRNKRFEEEIASEALSIIKDSKIKRVVFARVSNRQEEAARAALRNLRASQLVKSFGIRHSLTPYSAPDMFVELGGRRKNPIRASARKRNAR